MHIVCLNSSMYVISLINEISYKYYVFFISMNRTKIHWINADEAIEMLRSRKTTVKQKE